MTPPQISLDKNYTKILFSILTAAICTVGFAADKPNCKKTGKIIAASI